ncbi:hypothetical protein SAMN04487996_14012 [Dyadobacter soli]|uniref:Uncharacterized protein n=1 Tax=Dyadobacter soli TaxID=659014 RepID=A0A1G8CUP2_9BACT|nr:hypothetical protein SAMN04487996_14012 [Dyadobacter soli]
MYVYLWKMVIYLFLAFSNYTTANFGALTINALYYAVSLIYK